MSGPQPTGRDRRQPPPIPPDGFDVSGPLGSNRASQIQDLDQAFPAHQANDGNGPSPSPSSRLSLGPNSGLSASRTVETWSGPITFREAVEKTREAPVLIRLEDGWRGNVEELSLSSGDVMALEGCIALKGQKVVMAHYVQNHEDLSRVLAQDAYRALVTLPLSTLPELEVSVLQDPAGDLYRNFVTGNFGECSWQNQKQEVVSSVESGEADYRDYVNSITVIDVAEKLRKLGISKAAKVTTPPGVYPVAPPRKKKNERPPPLLPRDPLQSESRRPAPPPPRAKAEAESCLPTLYNVFSRDENHGPRPDSLSIMPIAEWSSYSGNDAKGTHRSSETAAAYEKKKSPQNKTKSPITKAKEFIAMTADALVQGLQNLSTQPERTTADEPEPDYDEICDEDNEEESNCDDNYECIDDTRPLPQRSSRMPPVPANSVAQPTKPIYVSVPWKGRNGKGGNQQQLRVEEKGNRRGKRKEPLTERTAQAKPTVHVSPRPQMPIPPTSPPAPGKPAHLSHPMMAPKEDIYEIPYSDLAERKPIGEMSCSQLYDRLVQCGMVDLAYKCRSKQIDGQCFMAIDADTFKKPPFSCDDFDVNHKIVQIKGGWVPRTEVSKSQMNTYTKM